MSLVAPVYSFSLTLSCSLLYQNYHFLYYPDPFDTHLKPYYTNTLKHTLNNCTSQVLIGLKSLNWTTRCQCSSLHACNKVLPYRFVPELSPRLYGMSLHDNMTHNTEGLVNIGVSSVSTSDLIQQLEHIYCGTLSAQFQQLSVSSSICVSRQPICSCFIVNT